MGADLTEHSFRLLVVVIGLTLPIVFKHYLDYRRCFWKVGGASRATMQANLLRRYLAYDKRSRELVPESLLVQTTHGNVKDVVSNGYLKIFPLMKNIGELIMIAILQVNIAPFGLAPM